MDCSLPGSSVHGTSQARILEQVATSFFGDLPDPGIEPKSPALAGGFFTTEPPGKAQAQLQLAVEKYFGEGNSRRHFLQRTDLNTEQEVAYSQSNML